MQANQMIPPRTGHARQPDWTAEVGGPVYQTAPMQGSQNYQTLPAQPGNAPAVVSEEPIYSDQQGVPGSVPGSTQGTIQSVREMQRPGRGTLDFSTGLTQDALESPMTTQEAYQGSIKGLLGQNLGHYVVATFLVGTQNPISWEGILHSVGNNYLVIFQPDQGRYITGDLYALKFVEFSDSAPGVVPPCTGYRRRDGQQIW